MRVLNTKKLYIITIIILLIFACKTDAFFNNSSSTEIDFSSSQKSVSINDNGLEFETITSKDTLGNLLDEKKIKISEHDKIIPELDTKLYPGINIEIKRALKIKIEVDGKIIENYTLERSIDRVLMENKVTLSRLDKTTPDKFSPPQNNLMIVVTRINIEEVVIPEDIDFKTITKTDSKMGWREKKTEQKGEKGIREVKYKITYKNGKEISRVALEKNITKDPTPEIIVQGTYVKLGDKHTGFGTWYANQGGLYAASPWLPMGSFAKVTNPANGKSVMVEINDRGPFGKNRIIDLDKVAFQKISALGAGVIDVKVEEVLN